MPEERLSAVLRGEDRVSSEIADISESLGGLVDNALAAAGGLELAESAADDLGDELDTIQSESAGAATGLASVAGAAEALDAAVSDVDLSELDVSDVDLRFDTGELDDTLATLRRAPDDADTARSALREIAESDALSGLNPDRDPRLDFDPETVQQRYALAVDRSAADSALADLDDRTIAVNPVLNRLRERSEPAALSPDEQEEDTGLDRTISVDTDNLSATLAAIDTLSTETDDLRRSLARLDKQGVSVTVDADVATAIADLETVDSKLDDIDDRRVTVDVAVDTESVATDVGAAVDAAVDTDTDTDTDGLSSGADVSGTDDLRVLSATVDEAGDVATEAADELGTFGQVSERVRQQTDRLVDRTARLRSLLRGDLGSYGGLRESAEEADRLADRIDALPDRVSRTVRLDVTDDIPGFESLGRRGFELDVDLPTGPLRGLADRLRSVDDRVRSLGERIRGFSFDADFGFDGVRRRIRRATDAAEEFAFGEESERVGVSFETDGVAAAADDATEVAEGVDEAAEAADMATDRLEQTEQQATQTTGRLERLRAAMDVRDVIPDSLTPSGVAEADPEQVDTELGATSRTLRIVENVDVNEFGTAAQLADALEANVDDLGESATAAAAQLRGLGEGTEELVDEEVVAATTSHQLADAIDEVGDESVEAAAEVGALRSSMGGLDDVGVNLGPFTTSLSRLLPLLAPLAAGLSSVAGAAVSVGAGFSAIGGAGLGMMFGGLTSRAEELAAQSSEIEDASEGLEEIVSQFGQAARNSLQPLQTEEFEGFAMGALSGVIEILRDGAQFAADFSDELEPVLDRLGSQFWNTQPEFFAELRRTASATLPYLEDLLSYLITAGPAALRWFREEGLETVDALGSFSVQAIDTAASLASVGNVLINTVVPGLTALASAADWALEGFRALPDTLQYAAMGAAVATAAASLLAVALGSAATAGGALAAVLGVLSLPISGTTAAIAGLVGATAGVISYFGAWGDIIGELVGIYNGLIEYVEYSINLWLGLAQAIANAAMSFDAVAGAVQWIGDLLDWLGGVLDWAMDKLEGVAEFVNDLAEAIGQVIGSVADAADEAGGVSLDEYKAGGDGEGEDGSGGGPGEPPDNQYTGRQSPGFDVTQPGSDGTVMGNAVASLPSTSPTAGSGGGGGSATTASTAGSGGGRTAARPTTGPAATGSQTINHYNYKVSVNAANLARQEMKRVARQIYRQLERMDRRQSTAGPG
jgi:methyl-accepting chemotaxis protein